MTRAEFLSLSLAGFAETNEVRLAPKGAIKLPLGRPAMAVGNIPPYIRGAGDHFCWMTLGLPVYLANLRTMQAKVIGFPELALPFASLREDGLIFFCLLQPGLRDAHQFVFVAYGAEGVERESFPSPAPEVGPFLMAGNEAIVWTDGHVYRGRDRKARRVGARRDPAGVYALEEVSPGRTWLLDRKTGELRIVDWAKRSVSKSRLPKEFFPTLDTDPYRRRTAVRAVAANGKGQVYVLLDSQAAGLEGRLILETDPEGVVLRRMVLLPQADVRRRVQPEGMVLAMGSLFLAETDGVLWRYEL